MVVVAVDPGDKFVGLACWRPDGGVSTMAVLAEHAVERVKKMLEPGAVLVIEEFRLYRKTVGSQIGSNFPTSQMIGALKYVAQEADVPVVEQGAGIKKPTRRQLRARGIKQTGRGSHARDAELHLWHFLLKQGEDVWTHVI